MLEENREQISFQGLRHLLEYYASLSQVRKSETSSSRKYPPHPFHFSKVNAGEETTNHGEQSVSWEGLVFFTCSRAGQETQHPKQFISAVWAISINYSFVPTQQLARARVKFIYLFYFIFKYCSPLGAIKRSVQAEKGNNIQE